MLSRAKKISRISASEIWQPYLHLLLVVMFVLGSACAVIQRHMQHYQYPLQASTQSTEHTCSCIACNKVCRGARYAAGRTDKLASEEQKYQQHTTYINMS